MLPLEGSNSTSSLSTITSEPLPMVLIKTQMIDTKEETSINVKKSSWLSLNLTSVMFAALFSVFGTVGALQFRIFTWLKPMEVVTFSYLSTIVFDVPVWLVATRFDTVRGKEATKRRRYLYLISKGIVTALALICYNQALGKIPSSLVQMIMTLNPLTALILSRIVLKEPLSVLKIVAFLFIAAGVVMVSCLDNSVFDVSNNSSLIIGIIYAIAGAFLNACCNVLTKMVSDFNVTTMCLSDSLIGIVIAVIIFIFTDKIIIPQCGITAFLVMIFSWKQPLTQVTLYYSCKFGQVGITSAIISGLNVVLAFVFDVAFFGLVPPFLEYFAAVLVLIGAGLNGFGHYITRVPVLNKAL